MNWFNLFNFLFKIQCAESNIKISKEYFLENNFWDNPRYPDKTREEYLYEVEIGFKEIGMTYCSNNSFYLHYTRQIYIYLQEFDAESFIFPLNYPQFVKKFIRFNFLFTIFSFKNYPKEQYDKALARKREFRRCETFKWPERSSKDSNIIYLVFYKDAAREINLKENITGFSRK